MPFCWPQLTKLQHLSVTNDAFFVWHNGPFGTINSFRLGSLPAQPVRGTPAHRHRRRGPLSHDVCRGCCQVYWVEINAALGQMAMLLATVCNRTGFIFSKYRIIPQGSFSKIAKIGDERTTYELCAAH